MAFTGPQSAPYGVSPSPPDGPKAPFQLSPGFLLFLPGLPGWIHWDGYHTYDILAKFYHIHIFLVTYAGIGCRREILNFLLFTSKILCQNFFFPKKIMQKKEKKKIKGENILFF